MCELKSALKYVCFSFKVSIWRPNSLKTLIQYTFLCVCSFWNLDCNEWHLVLRFWLHRDSYAVDNAQVFLSTFMEREREREKVVQNVHVTYRFICIYFSCWFFRFFFLAECDIISFAYSTRSTDTLVNDSFG